VGDRTFEIFALKSNQTAVFLESVSGLSTARERMDQIAANAAGRYLLVSSGSRIVIARTETFQQAIAPTFHDPAAPRQELLKTAPALNGTPSNAMLSKADSFRQQVAKKASGGDQQTDQ
jgi:hypothetical protein